MKTPVYAQVMAITAVIVTVGPAIIAPLTAQAQDSGGVLTRLGVSQSISADNSNADTSLRAQTTLDYNIRSETRTETIILNAVGVLRGVWADGAETDTDVTPRANLSYKRDGAKSSISLQASATRSDIAYTSVLSDFLDADGNFVLPDDFDGLTGTGTRQALGFSAALSLRDDAPFGVTLNLSHSDLSYQDVTSADLTDKTNTSFGITGRFNINDAVQANLGLRYRIFDDEVDGSSEQFGLTGGVNFAQPAGTLGLSFNLNKSDGGTSTGFQVSRALDLPNGTVSGSLGVTLGASDNIFTTGTLGWRQELERGNLTAQISRGVTTGSDDAENVITSLSLGTSYALSPSATVSLNAGYAQNEKTATNVTTELANVGISYSHTLTPDWSLSAGASYRNRTSTGFSDTDTSSLSLTLNRTFEARY